MRISISIITGAVGAFIAGQACSAVGADEARQLGSALTPIGAEMAGSKDGAIPAYSAKPIAPPASFKAGSGLRPDPFAAEKPRLVVTGKNLAEHADKLSEGAKELLKRHPSFRIDVYPTHRTVVEPQAVQDNTLKNATAAKTTDGGLGLENALPGVPFPIPKTGNEAMWNHLVRYQGKAFHGKYEVWNVDSAGIASLSSAGEAIYEWPIYAPARMGSAMQGGDHYWRIKIAYSAPARRAGEAFMFHDSVNPAQQPRRAWQYLPGQRRVRLAPDIAYDTPNPGLAGAATYDDANGFNGAMDRFDFKLVGKREMFVPYNTYRLAYHPKMDDVTTPNHLNPDLVRWEQHRVWVVEATLKPGKRHAYSKRVFYLDEDSWTVVTTDQYDARGQLYRSFMAHISFSYDAMAMNGDTQVWYDFVSGAYSVAGLWGKYFLKYIDPLAPNQWAPDSLAGAGIR